MIKLELPQHLGSVHTLVFEDRVSMVAMWRSRGIVCCQVAPEDF
ncbi:phosphatase domain-containing protein [Methylobacterium aerolatum]